MHSNNKSHILLIIFAVLSNFISTDCWQPLLQVNSTFEYPKENYTLFSSSIDPNPIREPDVTGAADTIRGYGFGGYDDDDRYVYSHSVTTVRNSMDLTNFLGILSLVGLLGTALYAVLKQTGSRALSSRAFDFLERNNLQLDFPLPTFFTKTRDFLLGSEPTTTTTRPVTQDPNLDLLATQFEGESDSDYDEY